MFSNYLKAKNWVEDIYDNADHLVNTAEWVKKLKPNASEALLIAAVTHDIEVAFQEDRKPPVESKSGGIMFGNEEYNLWHGNRSAEYVRDFLEKDEAPEYLIEEVSDIIALHEGGGSPEANILRDADSISWLDVNAPAHIALIPVRKNAEVIKGKVQFMFDRIESSRAKKYAEPLYKKAIAIIEKLEEEEL